MRRIIVSLFILTFIISALSVFGADLASARNHGKKDKKVSFGTDSVLMGTEGCTPGYWKQSHHIDSWPCPCSPEDLFSDIFEDAFPGMTLLDVLNMRGGGLSALGRHIVAALLNSVSEDVDYGYTPLQVIMAFNYVYPDSDYEELKDVFEFLNERGCSLE